ncbi:adhesion G-protein coupled receptor G5-like [Spinachia spinachia]
MEPRLTADLRAALVFLLLFSTGSSDNDLNTSFCGTWRHDSGALSLSVNLSTGCSEISISAGRSSLSIHGQITARCNRSEVIPLKQLGLDSQEETAFCLYWEPLLDQLKLQVGGKNLSLCWPSSVQGSCCTDLSSNPNAPEANYGIVNGTINNDIITDKTREAYSFTGASINCKALCDQQIQGSIRVNVDPAGGNVEHPCAHSSEVDMKEGFRGRDITAPAIIGGPRESRTTVHLPPALKTAAKKTSNVVCTFFNKNSLFQEGHKEKLFDEVVGITVENEVIANLSETITIVFHHDVIPQLHSKKCVSWDTRKDPWLVNWLVDGCETREKGAKHTECLCNHLTYFSVLVQMEPRPVRHLLALTAITSLGCAVSVISCVAVFVFLCRKRRCKEQSIPIHMGLALSLGLLNLLFFFTGVLANVGGERLCLWVGAGLHYTLLSSFTWMGVEVFHTFWLVHMVFSPSLRACVWNLVGFALPALPVIILAAVGDIYGVREVWPSDDVSNPYRMCWMKDTPKALLAHYFTNMTALAVLVISGSVMLLLVYRKIRSRDEWRQNRVAFLSIWGLSCLYGTSWGLTFLDFGPLSDVILFLSCILNAFQGFFLMLRFYMLDWMRKQTNSSAVSSTSTGSTRQHMLQAQEKS